jgi:hypothetical protein
MTSYIKAKIEGLVDQAHFNFWLQTERKMLKNLKNLFGNSEFLFNAATYYYVK